MEKHTEILEKSNKVLKDTLKSENSYINFLKFYSKIYKYNLINALLIYSQNSKANAFATYNEWKQVGYQVRKGEKGIALFTDDTFNKIKYVFGVDSTYQRKINLWKYNEENHKNIIEEHISKTSFEFLDKTSYNYINEDLKDFTFYSNLLCKYTRLGIDIDKYLESKIKQSFTEGLNYIRKSNIDRVELFTEICFIVEDELRKIEKIIKSYERERINNYGRNESDRWNNILQGGTRLLVSEDRTGRTENREMEQNGYGAYENHKTWDISNVGSNEQISIDFWRDRQESVGNDRRYDGEETQGRTDTRELEHIRTDISQEDVTERSGGSSNQGIDTDRPLSRDRYERVVGSKLNNEIKSEKEHNNVPFFVSKYSGDSESGEIDFSFQTSNYDLENKKISYPTTTNDKIQANIEAIKTLLKIESENRIAKSEEKEILSNYVGWGGLPQVFENIEDIRSGSIREKAKELKELLTEEEYISARSSTLNAHYTPNEIIKSMYEAVKNFGYNGKINILEPSCATGNFIGNIPNELKDSRITGVELDSVSGRIAKQLYPLANIKIKGFEKEFFRENSFDLVIGNVPFGDYSIYDKKYNKNNYLIHDYFINKSIELLKPNGIIAVITSKGTLDKKDPSFRKEISKKAELIGAIRLPNTAFKQLAGTEVTSDILFFQKLEKEREEIPSWVETKELELSNRINNYFVENPSMILGTLEYKTNRYGRYDLTVVSENKDLYIDLQNTINMLPKNIINQDKLYIEEYLEEDFNQLQEINEEDFKPYRYKILNNQIYYKNDNGVEEVKNIRNKDRLVGMITLRDLSKELIDIQLDRYSDESIFEEKLKYFNDYYDKFVSKYGYINNRQNINAFKEDDDIHFLTSLEKADKEKYVKGDFFYKRTVAPIVEITSVDNAKDGLILSLNKFAKVDFDYIKSLYNKPINEIIDELIEDDLIFLNPLYYQQDDITKGWEIKSIYLNGNVKEKLKIAESLVNESPYFARNIDRLKEVIPKDVEFVDIKIDMGSDLYKVEDIKLFAKELLNLAYEPNVHYNTQVAEWSIYNKGIYGYLAREEYGTSRIGALYILEKMLNNQEVLIKDEIETPDGKTRFVTNKEETIKANEKKILIEKAFDEFIHRNKNIRDRIEKEYNERFNNSINSNWDIELQLPNLSYDIKLRPHQKRAVARSIFSPNNLLLDHQVGAGKTFIMIVSAMEKKRLKIANKPLLIVPNNITGQFKNDFYRLYPNANILYADEKSFETKNRKRFLSKIAQNDYDAVIMGQSQFDLLKISKERQLESIEEEINNIVDEISQLDKSQDRPTIKILERTKKSLEKNLEKLLDSQTEDILEFEQLGIDALYLDEAHLYKNLYFTTKLRNVAGINQTNSQKALNLKMKIDYLEEIGAKITFATGTPISNTMAEMYTMQRFLAQNELKEQGLYHFDSWQKIYANTETKIEISPTGTGFQTKTRFSNFRNIPELMNFYNKFADVITTEMINLPIPKYESYVIEAETSEELATEMNSFGERAEMCKKGIVNPKEDNILKIVHEGRYAGLDIRHINEEYQDYENSKVNLLVNKVFEIYSETMENKSTQVIFSDLSTPKKDEFNIYDDIKEKLINKGVKEEEIAFVHSAKNSKDREKMFEQVRTGEIRVILGSTSKMGAGTNFQDKLIALYHLDTPWRPSDLEQREGRILRQGNENDNVKIFRCVTKGSFDAYSWQILEQKQRFIAQAKVGAITGREVKDIDEVSIDYAEIKALATGNPLIKRKMEVDTEIEKMKVLETAFRKQLYSNQKFLEEEYPGILQNFNNKISNITEDLKYIETISFDENNFNIVINNNKYTDKEVAGELLLKLANKSNTGEKLGEYKGFIIYSDSTPLNCKIKLCKNSEYKLNLNNGYKKGNIDLLDSTLSSIKEHLTEYEEKIKNLETKKELVEKSIKKEFEHKETLLSLYKEKAEIEKSFEDENKTFVELDIEENEQEVSKKVYEEEIEL